MNALRKAEIELDKEYHAAIETIYYATILVLKREYGFGSKRIEHFFDRVVEIYQECRSSYRVSLVQMCDKELGIEIRSDKDESYLDCPYLCQEDWEQKRDAVFNKMTSTQQKSYMIVVRQKMKNWMFPQVLATVLLGLSRKEGFGYKRILVFMEHLQKVREEYQNNIPIMAQKVEEETGMRFAWTKNNDFALLLDEKEKTITS